MTADMREAVQEGEEQQAAPAIGSLEAIVEEQAAAEGAARQVRVHSCCQPPCVPLSHVRHVHLGYPCGFY